MQTLAIDFERSAKRIFKLFFNSKIQVKRDILNNYPQWGVDLPIECNGKKKFTLFIEESTLRSVIKNLTGEDNLNNHNVVYGIIGEIARFIAGNAIGERSDNYTMHHPMRVATTEHRINTLKSTFEPQEFALSIKRTQ